MSKVEWEEKYSTDYDEGLSFFLEFVELKRAESFKPFIKPKSLEVGPGKGIFLSKTSITHILDVSLSALEKLKLEYPIVETAHYSELPLPFANNSFCAVCCNDVLHHIQEDMDLVDFIIEVKRVLKPGGFFLISDRRDTFLVSLLLRLNKLFRTIFLSIHPNKMTMGATIELPMRKQFYDVLFSEFKVIQKKKWRSVLVYFLVSVSFFLNLIIPSWFIKRSIYPLVCWIEENLCVFPTDYLLILENVECHEQRKL